MSLVSKTYPGIYYGWWILAAGMVMEMLALGSTSYAAGLFVIPLESELGLSRTAANSSVLISFLGAAFMAPVIGFLLDRYAISRVLIASALVFGLGFLVIAATSSLAVMVVALFFPVAFGGMAIGQLTTTTLVSRWFYRRRGRALGIAAVATSGGGIVVVPLLSTAIEAYGWRVALSLEAIAITLIVVAIAIFVVRNGPADLGLTDHPENVGRPASDVPAASGLAAARSVPTSWPYGRIVVTLNFWAIGAVLSGLVGIAMALVITAPPYVAQLGFSAANGALLITVFAVTAACVKLVSGWLAEFVDRRLIMFAATIAMLASLLLLSSSTSYLAITAAYCLAGIAQGCILPASSALVATFFGAPSFGRIMGAMYIAVMLACVAAVLFVGGSFDQTGSYDTAFRVFAVASALIALAAILIRSARDEPIEVRSA